MKDSSTSRSAEAKGRELAKAVSGDGSGANADHESDTRNVDGAANAKGRELAQAISGTSLERTPPVRRDEHDHDDGRRARIAQIAYAKAEQRGFRPGGEMNDWLAAEREFDESEGSGVVG